MEKAKAYIKNELRGGNTNQNQLDSSESIPQVNSNTRQISQGDNLESIQHANSQYSQQQNQSQMYASQSLSAGNKYKLKSSNTSPTPEVIPLCYVCGAPGGYEPIRVRPNPNRPNESYFPFLERHEAPNGVPQVTPNQMFVMGCMLCYRSLNEQWDAYEREKKPLLQRIYHMKRVDGKSYIGADISTQGEYAAQMLGLSAEHLAQSGHSNDQSSGGDAYASYSNPVQKSSTQYHNESPQRSNSRNGSSSPHNIQLQQPHSFLRKTMPTSNRQGAQTMPNEKAQENDFSQQQQQHITSSNSRPSSASGTTAYETLNIKPSSFAHHKLKLGQVSYMNSISGSSYAQQQQQHPQYQQQYQATNSTSQLLSYSTTEQQNNSRSSPYLANSCGITSQPSHARAPTASSSYSDSVLDLRNSSASKQNATSLTQSASCNHHHSQNAINANAPINHVEVGILDLSMPDKNSTTEVCYACGGEQRRGSLIELSTVEPKDSKDINRPYFPIFNEQHPRPARSRPKDPRGMIQTCRQCYEHLMSQWQSYQVCYQLLFKNHIFLVFIGF